MIYLQTGWSKCVGMVRIDRRHWVWRTDPVGRGGVGGAEIEKQLWAWCAESDSVGRRGAGMVKTELC